MRKYKAAMLAHSIIPVVFALLAYLPSAAQGISINNSGAGADSSAMLDISSTTKGILIPRMSSQDKGAIASPAEGLLIYDTDTKGFWYYSNNTWNELPKSTAGGLPTGPADGDLSGNYPAPNVVKIQNLAVAPGVPANKQVMKWDGTNNKWQGQNDSLFLPYISSFNSPSKLFSITNPNTSFGATAVFGKTGNGSGVINPVTSVGVWGDNSSGHGVLATSNTGIGMEGFSTANYGVYGSTYHSSYAGVYGTNASGGSLGVAVMGDIVNAGISVYGQNTGIGNAGKFFIGNSNNNYDAVQITTNGTGRALYANISNVNNGSTAMNIITNGTGKALYATISNPTSSGDVATFVSDGIGRSLTANNTNVNNTQPTAQFSTSGNGHVLLVNVFNASNNKAAADINTNGLSHALYASNTNVNNNTASIYALSYGMRGMEGVATGIGVNGRTTTLNGGVGLLGQSHLDDDNGIGVKGISYSNNLSSGAVTGINNNNGVAVFGESTNGGIAIYGKTSRPQGPAIYGTNNATGGQAIRGTATGADGVAIYGEAGTSNSTSYAGYFRNANAANTKNVVQIDNLGTGNYLALTDGLGDTKLAFAKSGNITTDGTLTVKGNKGIIRNSGSGQLRYEVISASITGDLPVGEFIEHTINFPTPFSSAPVITTGNESNGLAGYIHFTVSNVTATSCKVTSRNISAYPLTVNKTLLLMAIGAE